MAKSSKMGGHFLSTEPDSAPKVGETVEQLPLAAIAPCPTNPRGDDLGDLEELAASIRETGIHQPLIVQPANGDEIHVIAFGHRRFAAARMAGLDVVPVIVRHYTPEQLLEAQIIENFARQDIDEVSEARAFQRLVEEFGYSQRRIAERVGCTQAHVSRRLSLLKLDPKALAALGEGKLTIAEAVELTKLDVLPPKQRQSVVSKFLEDRFARAYLVRNAVEDFNRKQTAKKLQKEAEAEGLRVVKSIDVWGTEQRYLREGYSGLNLNAEQHRAEPCHAVSIENGQTHPVCMDSRRHLPDGESALKVGEEVLKRFQHESHRDEAAAQRKAEQEALEQAHNDRCHFIKQLLSAKVSAAEAAERLVDSFLSGSPHDGFGSAWLVCSYLDVEPVKTPYGDDYKGGLRQWLSGLSGAARAAAYARTVMAIGLAEGEQAVRRPYYHSGIGALLEHYEALVARGYRVSEPELAHLQEHHPVRLTAAGVPVIDESTEGVSDESDEDEEAST